MYSDVLNSLSSKIFTTVPNILRDQEVKSKIYSLIKGHSKDTLISTLATRSPILADLATSIMEKLKESGEERDKILTALSKDSKFRDAAKVATKGKDDAEIATQLQKLFSSYRDSGEKSRTLYPEIRVLIKNFEKIISDKSFRQEQREKTKTSSTSTTSTTAVEKPTTVERSTPEILEKIENNTEKTVEKLTEVLSSDTRNSSTSNNSNQQSSSSSTTEKKKYEGFKTNFKENLKTSALESLSSYSLISSLNPGDLFRNAISMGITAIDSSLRQTIREKIQDRKDSKNIEKFERTRENFNTEFSNSTTETENEREKTTKQDKIQERQNSLLESIQQILSGSEKKESSSTTAKSSSILSKIKEFATSSILSKIPGMGGIIGGVLSGGALAKTLPLVGGAISSSGGLLSKAAGGVANVASKGSSLLAAAAPAIGGAISAALPAAGAIVAGGAGYMIGDKLVKPLVDKGVTTISGKDNTLGTWLGDVFKSDAEKKLEAENKKYSEKYGEMKITSQKIISDKSSQISSMKDTKESMIAKDAKQQPIVIQQNSSTTNGSGNQQVPSIIGINKSVRNQDSTFERVQMRDFWSRSY